MWTALASDCMQLPVCLAAFYLAAALALTDCVGEPLASKDTVAKSLMVSHRTVFDFQCASATSHLRVVLCHPWNSGCHSHCQPSRDPVDWWSCVLCLSYMCLSTPEACTVGVANEASSPPALLAGHYVVLCGHDAATDCFMVQDPASCRPYLRLPATTFDSARRAFGTDEDLLFISAEGRPLNWLMTPDCNPGV